MEVLGIKFVPLNTSLERRLQTLAAAAWLYTFTIGGVTCALLALYLMFYTHLKWVVVLYLLWVYIVDIKTPEKGGRINTWVKTWRWWKYFKDYFPQHFVISEGVDLDPKKNYLFGCFPHGIMPTGIFSAIASPYGGFKEYFPRHEGFLVTLSQQFIFPFCRELILSLGGISSSKKSIGYVLGKPGGGNVVALVIGGAREAYNCKPGSHRIVLRQRKGFVKVALQSGAHLVPVFSFGETDLYDQLDGPRFRKIQEALRRWIVIAPVLPIGRGFFQYSFGLIPRRRPVTTVVGKPIQVPKIEGPRQEDIDKYHSTFINKLTELFEQHKYKYLENPESKRLIIE